MTTFGYFDDENHDVQKYIKEIESSILPDNLKTIELKTIDGSTLKDECCEEHFLQKLKSNTGHNKNIYSYQKGGTVFYEHDTDKSLEIKKQIKEFMVKNQNMIVDKLRKDIDEKELSENVLSGVALRVARGWTDPSEFPTKIGKYDRGHKLPELLQDGFNNQLKNIAYHTSKMQLDEFDNHESWDIPKNRQRALKKQIKLFTPLKI
jgi:hypothetical protein